MLWKELERHRDAGLLMVRLGFGLGFLFYHGWDKLIGGPERWVDIGSAIGVFGIGFGWTLFGFLSACAESVGGVLFAAGFLFRPVAALMAINMFVASSMHIVNDVGSPAHAVKNMIFFTGMTLVGPGKYSIDNWPAETPRKDT